MDAEDFSVDDGGKDEEVEHMTTRLPNGGVAVFLLTFFVESVYLSNLTRLVVSADEDDSVGVSVKFVVSSRVLRAGHPVLHSLCL